MPAEQDYCDWCHRPIDTEDRERSRDLGLDGESSFACSSCIDEGRIFSPPDGWEGDREGWPFRDIRDEVDLARANVEVVLNDVRRTTGLDPTVTVDQYMNGIRIVYGSNYRTPSVHAASNPDALAETADYLQDHVAEDIWSAWPVCELHDKGAYAEVYDGEPVWWCRFGSHPISAIGKLGVKNP